MQTLNMERAGWLGKCSQTWPRGPCRGVGVLTWGSAAISYLLQQVRHCRPLPHSSQATFTACTALLGYWELTPAQGTHVQRKPSAEWLLGLFRLSWLGLRFSSTSAFYRTHRENRPKIQLSYQDMANISSGTCPVNSHHRPELRGARFTSLESDVWLCMTARPLDGACSFRMTHFTVIFVITWSP